MAELVKKILVNPQGKYKLILNKLKINKIQYSFIFLKFLLPGNEGHCLVFTYCPVPSLAHLPLTVLKKEII